MNKTQGRPGASIAILLAMTASLAAQTSTVVYFPDQKFERDEGAELMFWLASPFDARRQIILDKTLFTAPSDTRLDALTFRRNGQEVHDAVPGRLHVEMWISNTTRKPGDLSPQLVKNRGRDHTRVFAGWLTLPRTGSASSSQRWLAPWAVKLTLTNAPIYQGENVLIETVTRVDPAARPWWPIDANEAKSHGDVKREGKSCIAKFGEQPAGAVEETAVLGGTLGFYLRGPRADTYGIFMMGTNKLDIDLTRMGAANCRLYVEPFWTWPIFYSKRKSIRDFGSAEVFAPLPNDPTFHDEHLYGQWLVVDPTENTLGITTSNRVKVKLKRASNEDTQMRMLESVDLESSVGNVFVGRLPILRLQFSKR